MDVEPDPKEKAHFALKVVFTFLILAARVWGLSALGKGGVRLASVFQSHPYLPLRLERIRRIRGE